jgi:hypothetical protein
MVGANFALVRQGLPSAGLLERVLTENDRIDPLRWPGNTGGTELAPPEKRGHGRYAYLSLSLQPRPFLRQEVGEVAEIGLWAINKPAQRAVTKRCSKRALLED